MVVVAGGYVSCSLFPVCCFHHKKTKSKNRDNTSLNDDKRIIKFKSSNSIHSDEEFNLVLLTGVFSCGAPQKCYFFGWGGASSVFRPQNRNPNPKDSTLNNLINWVFPNPAGGYIPSL